MAIIVCARGCWLVVQADGGGPQGWGQGCDAEHGEALPLLSDMQAQDLERDSERGAGTASRNASQGKADTTAQPSTLSEAVLRSDPKPEPKSQAQGAASQPSTPATCQMTPDASEAPESDLAPDEHAALQEELHEDAVQRPVSPAAPAPPAQPAPSQAPASPAQPAPTAPPTSTPKEANNSPAPTKPRPTPETRRKAGTPPVRPAPKPVPRSKSPNAHKSAAAPLKGPTAQAKPAPKPGQVPATSTFGAAQRPPPVPVHYVGTLQPVSGMGNGWQYPPRGYAGGPVPGAMPAWGVFQAPAPGMWR